MNTLRTSCIAATIAAFTLAMPARSSVIAYDGFNYTNGASLPGLNGGTGFSGPYTGDNPNLVTTPGFNYTDSSMNMLATMGNKASIENEKNVFRTLANSPDAPGTTLYISFIMKDHSTGGYAGLSLFQGGNENLFLGKPNGTNNFGINGNAFGEDSSTPADQQSLLVYRLDFTATSTIVSLYVNPILGVEPTKTDASRTGGAFTYDSFRLQSGNSSGFDVDEIRFGDSFADVTPAVPEPATAAAGALLLGFATVSIYRRRRSLC